MKARSSHYNSQKIKKLSELFKYYALLKNYFVSLFYHQFDVKKTLFSKRKFVLFYI